MLKIRLLGRCTLESDTAIATYTDIKCVSARELLGYLACRSNRVLSREVVIGELWGGLQEEQGNRMLRQNLWQLKKVIGQFEISATRPFIEAGADWLRLNPNSSIWLDVVQFEQLDKAIRRTQGEAVSKNLIQDLEEGVSLYRGHFLEDCFSDWCVGYRNVLRQKYAKMLCQLMLEQQKNHDSEGAMATARRLLVEEPASDEAHAMIMMLHYQQGDRTSALRQFQLYKKIMREEFNVPPAKALVDLYKKIGEEAGLDADDQTSPGATERCSFEERMIAILEDIRREIALNREDIRQIKDAVDRKKSDDENK